MIYEMCQMSYYLLRPTPSWKCIGGVLPLKSLNRILKVKLLQFQEVEGLNRNWDIWHILYIIFAEFLKAVYWVPYFS